jgi:hypothetical protein
MVQAIRSDAAHRPIPPPPAMPRHLVDVIGVGSEQSVAGVALALLSMERYREGAIVQFRLLRPTRVLRRELPWPELRAAVVGADGAFRVMPMGAGGGGMREMEYRLSVAILPAPSIDAGQIVIEVSEIAWMRHTPKGERTIVTTDPGPWRFVVTIGAAAQ